FVSPDEVATDTYTLSLHDALPISGSQKGDEPCQECPEETAHDGSGLEAGELLVEPPLEVGLQARRLGNDRVAAPRPPPGGRDPRSEEHTSELQSRGHLVCRLLPEK